MKNPSDERLMQPQPGFWSWYGFPVLVSVALFSGLNALYTLPTFAEIISAYYFLYSAVVAMAGGSLASLFFLGRCGRAGLLSRDDLGLGAAGWTAPRRLAALVVIAGLWYYGYTVLILPSDDVPGAPVPTWTDLCFWFGFLLSTSLAEALVFISVGFCLLRLGLRSLGLGPAIATALAMAFSSVTFGLYHYTHPPKFHALAVPLIAEMFVMLIFFLLTRNFFLTLVLHNLTAAIGFTHDQATVDPSEMAAFVEPKSALTNAAAFIIPFVLLHALEWSLGRQGAGVRSQGSIRPTL
jgi:hypothetical protein